MMDKEIFDEFWEMVETVRADLTDNVYWGMVNNPQGRVPYLVR